MFVYIGLADMVEIRVWDFDVASARGWCLGTGTGLDGWWNRKGLHRSKSTDHRWTAIEDSSMSKRWIGSWRGGDVSSGEIWWTFGESSETMRTIFRPLKRSIDQIRPMFSILFFQGREESYLSWTANVKGCMSVISFLSSFVIVILIVSKMSSLFLSLPLCLFLFRIFHLSFLSFEWVREKKHDSDQHVFLIDWRGSSADRWIHRRDTYRHLWQGLFSCTWNWNVPSTNQRSWNAEQRQHSVFSEKNQLMRLINDTK